MKTPTPTRTCGVVVVMAEGNVLIILCINSSHEDLSNSVLLV